MPEILKNPISEIYKHWNKAIEPVVGKGNFSMDRSQTLASGKKTYARLYMLGNVLTEGDLEGDECATVPTVQIECFATGTDPLAKVYQIDEKVISLWLAWAFVEPTDPNSWETLMIVSNGLLADTQEFIPGSCLANERGEIEWIRL